jgi:hypothetical protein
MRRTSRRSPEPDSSSYQSRFGGQPIGEHPDNNLGGWVFTTVLLAAVAGVLFWMGNARAWMPAAAIGSAASALWSAAWSVSIWQRRQSWRDLSGWRFDGRWPQQPPLTEIRDPIGMQVMGIGFALAIIAGLGAGIRSQWPQVGMGSLFMAGGIVVLVCCVVFMGYRIAQHLRFTPSTIDLDAYPMRLGGRHRLRIHGPALPLDDPGCLHAEAVLLQERLVRVHSRRGRDHSRAVVDRLATATVALRCNGDARQNLDLGVDLALPATMPNPSAATRTGSGGGVSAQRRMDGSYQTTSEDAVHPDARPITMLDQDQPRYWLLTLTADLPGIDWRAEWILPVYDPTS